MKRLLPSVSTYRAGFKTLSLAPQLFLLKCDQIQGFSYPVNMTPVKIWAKEKKYLWPLSMTYLSEGQGVEVDDRLGKVLPALETTNNVELSNKNAAVCVSARVRVCNDACVPGDRHS